MTYSTYYYYSTFFFTSSLYLYKKLQYSVRFILATFLGKEEKDERIFRFITLGLMYLQTDKTFKGFIFKLLTTPFQTVQLEIFKLNFITTNKLSGIESEKCNTFVEM